MANEQHLSLLLQSVKDWNQWRQRNPRIIPDLSEIDFGHASLFQANLSQANLSGSNLSGAGVEWVDLSGANLSRADLSDRNLVRANMNEANLNEANLSRSRLNIANLSKSNFRRANLSGADLTGQDLRGNDFTGANLSRANLREANLSEADLRGADLSEANLDYANLRQAQVHDTVLDEKWHRVWEIVTQGAAKRDFRNADLSKADLKEANLSDTFLCKANFSGTNLCRANLRRANLTESNLRQVDLDKANLRLANLNRANLREANLSEADLRGANLSEANLDYANLRQAQIQDAVLDEKLHRVWEIVTQGAAKRDLRNADLSKTDLSKVDFKEANLSGGGFSEAILSEADLSWADLSGADLRKATLSGVHLDNANLKKADLSEVVDFGSISCKKADFSEANFGKARIGGLELLRLESEEGANFDEANFREADIVCQVGANFPIRNKREFFDILLAWNNQETFKKSLEREQSLSKDRLMPGILLYTEEDYKLSLYVKENFEALDELTGDWCAIYLLETPPPKWRHSHYYWKEILESSLHEKFEILNYFRTKPYNKSEAYDIARQLNIEPSTLPCLVLISPENLSEKLIVPIREVSPDYFRKLFSALEKVVINVISQEPKHRESRVKVFNHLKINIQGIINYLEKHVSKQEEEAGTKYILEGENIFVEIYDHSRRFTVGNVGADFKINNSAILSDNVENSGTVVESTNCGQKPT